MAQMKVVVVECDDQGNIDLDDLRAKAEQHSAALSAIMLTYPSTHGVFEEGVREACAIVHQHGGQVNSDGANMNAQGRSEEHTSELQSRGQLVCRLLLDKKKNKDSTEIARRQTT